MCLEVGHDLAPWILVKVGSLVLPAGISPITVLKPEPQTQRPTCSASRFLDPRVGHGGDHRLSFQDASSRITEVSSDLRRVKSRGGFVTDVLLRSTSRFKELRLSDPTEVPSDRSVQERSLPSPAQFFSSGDRRPTGDPHGHPGLRGRRGKLVKRLQQEGSVQIPVKPSH
ncbi:hypothetical protein AGIG_G18175 [Arapaima gigas]